MAPIADIEIAQLVARLMRRIHASLLTLTEEGRVVVGALQRAVADALGDVLSPLPATDRQQLRAILRRVMTQAPPAPDAGRRRP